MDPAILAWMIPIVAACGPFRRVLELGSRNINGSVRPAFPDAIRYVGVDQLPGPDVDVVSVAHRFMRGAAGAPFECVVASSFFEHDPKFWLTLAALPVCLTPGGWLIITVPNQYFPVHEYPGDYYRFTEQAIREILFAGFEEISIESPICPQNQNIGAWGRRA